MSGDYLWDKSEPADPDVVELEEALAPLRHRPKVFDVTSRAPAPAAPPSARARSTRSRPTRRGWLVAGGLLAAAAAVALVVPRWVARGPVATLAALPAPPEPRWEALDARLTVGSWLETGDHEVVVAIADIGHVRIAPRTRLRVTEATLARQRLELASGALHARVVAPPRLFVVGTPAAEAVDLGCEYDLSVDARGDGHLAVTSGWVVLERAPRTALVPAGARCELSVDRGPGTPYWPTASEALRAALAAFDAGTGGRTALQTILREADSRDGLTLWHLLRRVDDDARRREVYRRLAELHPPPAGVRPADVLELREPALEGWRASLSVTW